MTSSALPKSRLLLLCGLTASIGLATALPAVGQSGDDPVQVSLVPQDFSDCSNANVKANGGETPGGTVVLVRRNDGSIDLKVGITATPDTKYNFYLKCVRQLGVITTGDEGTGEAAFTIPPNTVGKTFAFDMYPDGAPAGNKFQSVQVQMN
jgi:hypothetical protein